MKFTSKTTPNLINYTFAISPATNSKTLRPLKTSTSTTARRFLMTWQPTVSKLPALRTGGPQRYDSYRCINFRYKSPHSNLLQSSICRVLLTNSNRNSRLSIPKKSPSYNYLYSNVNYLRYLFQFTWSTQLLSKQAWYTLTHYLPYTSLTSSRWVKSSASQVTLWNHLLLTKI